jgi:F1F0 ATPase subunit 2
MEMNETLTLLVALGAGGALGAVFFGGLWWTVKKGVSSTSPALWFSGSLLLRISLALTGFYLVSGGNWQRLLACFFGFFIARQVVARWAVPSGTPSSRESPTRPVREASHAPES